MANCWLYKYGDDTIKVVNKSLDGSEMYINDELCAQNNGLSLSDRLTAKLKNGESVEVSLGGTFKVKCSLFIDGKLQEPVEVK